MAKIGIDLGTTNTVVATIGAAGTRILDNKEGENMTPSVVSIRNNEIIVGSVAKKRLVIDPLNTIYSVKRLLGRGVRDEEVQKMQTEVPYSIIQPSNGTDESVAIILNDQEYSPIDISSEILRKIKSDVEYRLGEEVKDAVITVPAYFSEIQRSETREAGIKAGFNVLQILEEPTAAAISYGINEESDSTESKIALVYDLGGGTFDISILAIAAGSVACMNLEGDMWLGGDNFDFVIIDQVVKELKENKNINAKDDPKLMAFIKSEAQKAKESLGASRTADIVIDFKGMEYETIITRESFEAKIVPLIARCEMLVDKAIKGAGFDGPDDIDIVIMAGNSTLIPAVQLHMEKKFGKDKIRRKIHPKLCVAEGAVMKAATIPVGEIVCPKCNNPILADAVKCNNCGLQLGGAVSGDGILPFSYGIEEAGDKFIKFYEKGTPYAIRPENQVTKMTHTSFQDQRMLKIPVYGGEFEKASQNAKQGEVFSVLPHGLHAGTGVRIKLWINKNGIFELQTMLESGEPLASIILRGKSDTKAVNEWYTKSIDYSEVKGAMNKEEQRAIEKQLEEALDYLKKGKEPDFENAHQIINKIILEKKDPLQPPPPPGEIDPELVINISTNILSKYGDFIDPSTKYELRGKIEQLSNAINSNNVSGSKILANELIQKMEDLMHMDINGQELPTPLGMAIQAEALLMQAEQINPAATKPLWNIFKTGVEKLKAHDPSGMNDLVEAYIEARKITEGPGSAPKGMIKCPNCKKMTPQRDPLCIHCHKDIRYGTSGSRDFLRNSLSRP